MQWDLPKFFDIIMAKVILHNMIIENKLESQIWVHCSILIMPLIQERVWHLMLWS
jgi:hypothetical protein